MQPPPPEPADGAPLVAVQPQSMVHIMMLPKAHPGFNQCCAPMHNVHAGSMYCGQCPCAQVPMGHSTWDGSYPTLGDPMQGGGAHGAGMPPPPTRLPPTLAAHEQRCAPADSASEGMSRPAARPQVVEAAGARKASHTGNKAAHNAMDIRRRRRIAEQLELLKKILGLPHADEALLLSEAGNRLGIPSSRSNP